MKAIFIDVDNTLLDFDEYVRSTMEEGFEKFDLIDYEPWMYDRFHEINSGLWLALERQEIDFSYISKNRWNIVFEELGIVYDGPTFEKYFRAQLNESAIIVDGALEMLDYLSERYILCAASNGPYHQQIHRLDIADMTKYFKHIFISEDLGASKPAREFFDEAFARINSSADQGAEDYLEASDCLMLGDSLTSDIKGGREYGMKTCYYCRKDPKDISTKGQIDYIITDLRQVKEFL